MEQEIVNHVYASVPLKVGFLNANASTRGIDVVSSVGFATL